MSIYPQISNLIENEALDLRAEMGPATNQLEEALAIETSALLPEIGHVQIKNTNNNLTVYLDLSIESVIVIENDIMRTAIQSELNDILTTDFTEINTIQAIALTSELTTYRFNTLV